MSYASANQNHENQFDLLETFLKKAGKNLNESLDTKERILPERRRANIEDAERVILTLPREIPIMQLKDVDEENFDLFDKRSKMRTELLGVYSFVAEMGMHKMREVLQRDFINGWDSMNIYDCMSDSFELSKILSNSGNMSDIKPWQKALQLRLEEKFIASKRALYNLDRVHDAYCNAIPLVENMVTPNDSYDSLYLTEELFPKTTVINQTYTRLRRNIKKYIENIDGLFHSYIADGHVEEILLNSNGILEASVEYDRDMRLYESLVIQQPLQVITNTTNYIKEMKRHLVNSNARWFKNEMAHYESNRNDIRNQWRDYAKSSHKNTLVEYLKNLKNERNVSKLSLAIMFTSDKTIKLVEKYEGSVARLEESFRRMTTAMAQTGKGYCNVYKLMFAAPKATLLTSWLTKQYGHYNIISDYEKAAMESYFNGSISSSIYRRILRRDSRLYWECVHAIEDLKPSFNFATSSLQQLVVFKNKLEPFLRKSRLDGSFFRYVSVI